MNEIFITKVKTNELKPIADLEIRPSENERKRLIITSRNGSGKTLPSESTGENIKLKFDRRNCNFGIIEQGKELCDSSSNFASFNRRIVRDSPIFADEFGANIQ